MNKLKIRLDIIISKHAEYRARTRLNWDLRELKDQAEEAIYSGALMVYDNTYGTEWRKVCATYGNNSLPYYNNGVIFIFIDDKLITVFDPHVL